MWCRATHDDEEELWKCDWGKCKRPPYKEIYNARLIREALNSTSSVYIPFDTLKEGYMKVTDEFK